MYFRISNFSLNIESKLSIVIGDTSTGKTALVTDLIDGEPYTTDAAYVSYVLDEQILEMCPSNTLFIIDEEYTASKHKEHLSLISNCSRDDVYIVMFSRAKLHSVPIPIEAIYKFITVKGVTKNIPYVSNLRFNLGNFKELLIEDSGSCLSFFKECFNSCRTLNGNGNVIKNLSTENLIIFDTLGFGCLLPAFIDKCKKNPNVLYAYYGSFEEFILNTLFNEYTDLIDMFPESRALKRLQELVPAYSKSSKDLRRLLRKEPLDVLKSSTLKDLLTLRNDYNIDDLLTKLGIPLYNKDKIISLLPTVELSGELLEAAIKTAYSML